MNQGPKQSVLCRKQVDESFPRGSPADDLIPRTMREKVYVNICVTLAGHQWLTLLGRLRLGGTRLKASLGKQFERPPTLK
jgi:hypothetical protein